MSATLALVRISFLTAISYRLNFLLSACALLVSIVPLYLVAGALDPSIGHVVQGEGAHFFDFLVLGVVATTVLAPVINSLPGALAGAIGSGTLESLFATPARRSAILGGMVAYPVLWSLVRVLLVLVAATLLGAGLHWDQLGATALVLALTLLVHAPFGLFAAALFLMFRTTAALPAGVLTLSSLLGGVYYPTSVIPSWLGSIADAVPLTYGLRAMRRTFLEGESLLASGSDIVALLAFAAVLVPASLLAFSMALRHARRRGSLAHY
jgi:ABC-2 type transport system permease protein